MNGEGTRPGFVRKKGHRQKGSGTVVTSRGESERHGVLCKEWQRTPMQLLHEMCQSQKRPKPFYHKVQPSTPDMFRMRCVLKDGKNATKDMIFCPEQSFESVEAAEHHAALLALYHIEPTRPHERKLPDPYKDIWLHLCSDSKKEKNSVKEKPSKKIPIVNKNAKAEEESINEESGVDFWGSSAQEEDTGVPAPPRTIELTNDRRFVSQAEKSQTLLESNACRNERKRNRENRERANPDVQVFMNATMRESIENILRRKLKDSAIHGLNEEECDEKNVVLDQKLLESIVSLGFKETDAKKALQQSSKLGKSGAYSHEVLSRALDWLCLNIPEGDLPRTFNPNGKQFEVVVNSFSSLSVDIDPKHAVIVQRMMRIGFSRKDCLQAIQTVTEVESDPCKFESLVHCTLHQKLHELIEIQPRLNNIALEKDLVEQAREDEVLALEAIYGECFQIESVDNGHTTFSVMVDMEGISGKTKLEVHMTSECNYPYEIPMVVIRNEAISPTNFLPAIVEMTRLCSSLIGEPMVFELCSWMQRAFSKFIEAPHEIELYATTTKNTASVANKDSKASSDSQPNTNQRSEDQKSLKRPREYKERKLNAEERQAMSTRLYNQFVQKAGSKDYEKMQRVRANLPSASQKEAILNIVEANQVVLLQGETGCGKTTQVPQFILDHFIQNKRGSDCNIVCTQPRRIAAIGVAMRVAEERAEAIGNTVGYHIRMEKKKSSDTRLLFCTTGVLLRRLLNDGTLSSVTHIIVDEVHERNVDTDFLLAILRTLIKTRRNLKLILMSATMDTELFVKYFSAVTKSCPVIKIPGFTYPVTCHYLEDALQLTKYVVPHTMRKSKKDLKSSSGDDILSHSTMSSKYDSKVLETLGSIDENKIDYALIAQLVKYLVDNKDAFGMADGSILIFMPGTLEIKRTCEALMQVDAGAGLFWVLPLHGGLSPKDQASVFRAAPPGRCKVVVSTNIAETSLTINDVVVVIDRGRVKETQYDADNRMGQLVERWTSRASADQRRGRAGRVRTGHCFRVYSKAVEGTLAAQQTPEIHRTSLEHLCLQVKVLGLGKVAEFLAQVIEPPTDGAIQNALEVLCEIGAIDSAEELQPLGHHLASLPVDARLGKCLIFGSLLSCIDPILTITAAMSARSPFIDKADLRDEINQKKRDMAKEKSDHMLLLRAYEGWRSASNGYAFCQQNFLSQDAMQTISDMREQFSSDLAAIGFLPSTPKNKQWGRYGERSPALNVNAEQYRVITAVLCAGLYANVLKVEFPQQRYIQTVQGAITESNKAKDLRYFIRSKDETMQRVFLHPASVNFVEGNYSSPWLIYNQLVRTSKVFVRESSMVSPYALLLFGGLLEVQHEQGTLTLDGWIRFKAVARIGVIIKAVRHHLGELLLEKIAAPELHLSENEIFGVISNLLLTNGL